MDRIFVPAPEDVAQDLLIGDRGEELVYRRELERVRSLGYEAPEKYVIWTSRNDAGADHDIRSITEDGGLLWIRSEIYDCNRRLILLAEKEFEKALRERESLKNNVDLWCREGDFIFAPKPGPRYQQVATFSVT